jgi:hypothetical protein
MAATLELRKKKRQWMCRDNSCRGFPRSAYCCIPLQPPLVYANQPKAIVVSKGYVEVITTSATVNNKAR